MPDIDSFFGKVRLKLNAGDKVGIRVFNNSTKGPFEDDPALISIGIANNRSTNYEETAYAEFSGYKIQ